MNLHDVIGLAYRAIGKARMAGFEPTELLLGHDEVDAFDHYVSSESLWLTKAGPRTPHRQLLGLPVIPCEIPGVRAAVTFDGGSVKRFNRQSVHPK